MYFIRLDRFSSEWLLWRLSKDSEGLWEACVKLLWLHQIMRRAASTPWPLRRPPIHLWVAWAADRARRRWWGKKKSTGSERRNQEERHTTHTVFQSGYCISFIIPSVDTRGGLCLHYQMTFGLHQKECLILAVNLSQPTHHKATTRMNQISPRREREENNTLTFDSIVTYRIYWSVETYRFNNDRVQNLSVTNGFLD